MLNTLLSRPSSIVLRNDLYAVEPLSNLPSPAVAAVARPDRRAPFKSMPFCRCMALAAPWPAMLPMKPAAKLTPSVDVKPRAEVPPSALSPPVMSELMPNVAAPGINNVARTPALMTIATAPMMTVVILAIVFQKLLWWCGDLVGGALLVPSVALVLPRKSWLDRTLWVLLV